MTVSAENQQEMIERRAKVASLRLAGIRNQRRIASELGVSAATINRDFKALDREWQARAVDDIATEKGLDLDRTERLIQAHWQDAIKGKWLATDRVLALMQHRAKLLGLEAPAKQDITLGEFPALRILRMGDES